MHPPGAGRPIHRGGIAMSGVCECSRRFQVQWDSISTGPASPVAQCRKLDHGQSSGLETHPRAPGLRWMVRSFSTNFRCVRTLKS